MTAYINDSFMHESIQPYRDDPETYPVMDIDTHEYVSG
jgi:hypothetical protein